MQPAAETEHQGPHLAPVGDEHVDQAQIEAMRQTFEAMKAAQKADPYPSYEERIARLDKLLSVTVKNRDAIAEAISADFGNRSYHETQIAEIFTSLTAIRYMKKQLKGWMKPRSRHVMLTLKPAKARVEYQPLGVVGIIAPWNYPYQLALIPLATAIAAGNRAMVKPSELTPRTAELMKKLWSEAFSPDVVSVVTGGPEVAAAFSSIAFDHLFFTGSTAVGRHVMQAAAKNLTPVTLELGGKSPAVVHESYPLDKAAGRIASGKWFNCGQTCIAPDYVLAPKGQVDALVEQLKAEVTRSYPSLADNRDYTAVVNERHYARLQGLIDDAVAKGATKIEINPAGETLDPGSHKIVPTILVGVTDEMRVMQEEIFGPVLPVRGYDALDQAIEYINDHDRPLALYYFDHDKDRAKDVLRRTTSGGAAINETVMHFAVDDLPFGGVGPSGMGAYHGAEGFETFSHKKAVLQQARINGAAAMSPPYGEKIDKLLGFLLGK
ncbi:MAG: coniferyl aldehyde dehydrogenase [Myxococcales bacterium]|jgi:coniferyl-aldehyde dehydrogenase